MATILVVEDNTLASEVLVRRLSRRGHAVTSASNGLEGVTKAQAELPDIILMDMDMPIVDGWEATRLLKAGAATQTIPIIAITALSSDEDREKSIAAGCDAHEKKPVEIDRLLELMESLMLKRRMDFANRFKKQRR
jgi:CheY-like chemotaxis protein